MLHRVLALLFVALILVPAGSARSDPPRSEAGESHAKIERKGPAVAGPEGVDKSSAAEPMRAADPSSVHEQPPGLAVASEHAPEQARRNDPSPQERPRVPEETRDWQPGSDDEDRRPSNDQARVVLEEVRATHPVFGQEESSPTQETVDLVQDLRAAEEAVAMEGDPISEDLLPILQSEAQRPPLAAPIPMNPGSASAEAAPALESRVGWIGGLLNATQDVRNREAAAQTTLAPVLSTPWFLLVFGLAVGASTGVVGVRRMIRRPMEPTPKPSPAPAQMGLGALVERVARVPMDAVACFQLGLELLRLGVEEDGLRLLDRSMRINPMFILQILQDPQLSLLREHPPVKRMLAQFKRDYDRRLLTAYV